MLDILPQEREQARGWPLIFGKEIAGELMELEGPWGEIDAALFARLLLRDNTHRAQLHRGEMSSLYSPQGLPILCENSAEMSIVFFFLSYRRKIGIENTI